MRQIFCNKTPTAPSTTVVNYIQPNISGFSTSGTWNTGLSGRRFYTNGAGVMSEFSVTLETAPGAGKSYTFVITVNNVDTALSITISDANLSGSIKVSHVIASNSYVALKCTPSGTPTATGAVEWSLAADLLGPKEFVVATSSGVAKNTATLEYHCIGLSNGWDSSLDDAMMICPMSATIDFLTVAISTAPGVGNQWTAYIYKNGSSVASLTITGTGTVNIASGLGVSVSPGDEIAIAMGPTIGTPAAFTFFTSAITFTAANNHESWVCGQTYNLTDTAATEYNQLMGSSNRAWTGTEATYTQTNSITPFYLKDLYVRGFIPMVDGDYKFTLRKNGADSALTATIVDTAQTGSDTTNTIYIDKFDTFCLQIEPISSPSTSFSTKWSVVQYTPIRSSFMSVF